MPGIPALRGQMQEEQEFKSHLRSQFCSETCLMNKETNSSSNNKTFLEVTRSIRRSGSDTHTQAFISFPILFAERFLYPILERLRMRRAWLKGRRPRNDGGGSGGPGDSLRQPH